MATKHEEEDAEANVVHAGVSMIGLWQRSETSTASTRSGGVHEVVPFNYPRHFLERNGEKTVALIFLQRHP